MPLQSEFRVSLCSLGPGHGEPRKDRRHCFPWAATVFVSVSAICRRCSIRRLRRTLSTIPAIDSWWRQATRGKSQPYGNRSSDDLSSPSTALKLPPHFTASENRTRTWRLEKKNHWRSSLGIRVLV